MATLDKPTAEASAEEGSQVATGATPPANDDIRLHPCLFPYTTKDTVPARLSKQLIKQAVPDKQKQARGLLLTLDERRAAAVTAVGSTSVPAAAREDALRQYLGLLQGLISAQPTAGAAAAPAPADGIDAALAEAEAGAAPPAATGAGDSPLRTAASFQWADVVLSQATATASDALFELASVLLAAVLAAAQQVGVMGAAVVGSVWAAVPWSLGSSRHTGLYGPRPTASCCPGTNCLLLPYNSCLHLPGYQLPSAS